MYIQTRMSTSSVHFDPTGHDFTLVAAVKQILVDHVSLNWDVRLFRQKDFGVEIEVGSKNLPERKWQKLLWTPLLSATLFGCSALPEGPHQCSCRDSVEEIEPEKCGAVGWNKD